MKTIKILLREKIMEMDRVFVASVHRKDAHELPDQQHLNADIVLIHRGHYAAKPLLYQLKKEIFTSDLKTLRHDLEQLGHDSFLFVGEVEAIDKCKKIVFLGQGSTLKYRHLISTTGTRQNTVGNTEFSNALKTLADALLVNQIQASFPLTCYTPYHAIRQKKFPSVGLANNSEKFSSKSIENIVNNHILFEEGIHSYSLGSGCLFDLQL